MELNLAHRTGWVDSGEDPGLPGQPPQLVWAGCYAELAALTLLLHLPVFGNLTHRERLSRGLQQVGRSEQLRWPEFI